jgi:hypothetical protein
MHPFQVHPASIEPSAELAVKAPLQIAALTREIKQRQRLIQGKYPTRLGELSL